MADTTNSMQSVDPKLALQEIAAAVPAACGANIILIGSLAVGYYYRDQLKNMAVRTKDADCLLSPRKAAILAGVAIADQLMDAGWTFKKFGDRATPGSEATPDKDLPAVLLAPPGQTEWFIELLVEPRSPTDRGQQWTRLRTRHGHFGLCSFGFLSLATVDPIPTEYGIHIARPEMMALANLLEHPTIGPATMSTGFAGRMDIKRSNKDLGRVLAIARLAIGRDEDCMQAWPRLWKEALQQRFPDEYRELGGRVGTGLRALLASEPDLNQALHTCVNGLLATNPPTLKLLRIAAERLLQDAIVPLEKEAVQGG
jgi:hypothetical protein